MLLLMRSTSLISGFNKHYIKTPDHHIYYYYCTKSERLLASSVVDVRRGRATADDNRNIMCDDTRGRMIKMKHNGGGSFYKIIFCYIREENINK